MNGSDKPGNTSKSSTQQNATSYLDAWIISFLKYGKALTPKQRKQKFLELNEVMMEQRAAGERLPE